jgi:TolB protein
MALLVPVLAAVLLIPFEVNRAQATFPGMNGLIIFQSTQDGKPDLYTMNADGSDRVRLTNSEGLEQSPSWSPDGSKIAFSGGANADIYVMNADGTEQTRLTSDLEYESLPSWSPDGTQITYTSSELGVVVMGADGTDQRPLVDDGGTMSWSPDGAAIVYAAWRGKYSQIYVAAPDGTSSNNVSNSPHHDFYPNWSPDGTKIVFKRVLPEAEVQVFVMNTDGSEQRQLTFDKGQKDRPSWSPDGTKIVFRNSGFGIVTMDADGSNVLRLSIEDRVDGSPDWQPTGVTLATPTLTLPGTPAATALPTATKTSPVGPTTLPFSGSNLRSDSPIGLLAAVLAACGVLSAASAYCLLQLAKNSHRER